MGYTASDSIARIKAKGFVSTATSLTDAEVLEWLNDAMRSYVVPFLKEVRDEWFVSGSEDVTPDSNGRIAMPNSIASTIRLITWNSNGNPVPLVRVEPENAYLYQNQNSGGQPYGYMLKAYEIQILPTNVGSISVHIDFMERPADMVLESDAGLISELSGTAGALALTLDAVPIAWQESTPAYVDIVSNVSPFSTFISDAEVVSLTGSVLTVDVSATPSLFGQIGIGMWVSDQDSNPFPNVPIEFHPLLQRSVITELYSGTGDKRLDGSVKLQAKLEAELRRTLSPRTQGSPRPIVNKNAVGMRGSVLWPGR